MSCVKRSLAPHILSSRASRLVSSPGHRDSKTVRLFLNQFNLFDTSGMDHLWAPGNVGVRSSPQLLEEGLCLCLYYSQSSQLATLLCNNLCSLVVIFALPAVEFDFIQRSAMFELHVWSMSILFSHCSGSYHWWKRFQYESSPVGCISYFAARTAFLWVWLSRSTEATFALAFGVIKGIKTVKPWETPRFRALRLS